MFLCLSQPLILYNKCPISCQRARVTQSRDFVTVCILSWWIFSSIVIYSFGLPTTIFWHSCLGSQAQYKPGAGGFGTQGVVERAGGSYLLYRKRLLPQYGLPVFTRQTFHVCDEITILTFLVWDRVIQTNLTLPVLVFFLLIQLIARILRAVSLFLGIGVHAAVSGVSLEGLTNGRNYSSSFELPNL